MRRAVIIGLAAIVILAGGALLWLRKEPAAVGPGDAAKPVASAASPSAVPSPQPASPTGAAVPAAPPANPAPAPSAAELPRFDVVRINPQGGAVIAGHAEPGAEVTVMDGDKVVGKVTADPRGDWVLLPDKPLPPGSRELSLSAQSSRDGSTAKSDGVVALMVPEAAPGRGGPAEGAVAVLVPRNGEAAVRPLQVPAASAESANPGSVPRGRAVFLDAVEYNAAGMMVFSGRAAESARVGLYVEGRYLGDAKADRDGRWVFRASQPMSVGRYRLRMDDIAPDGKVAARSALVFARDSVPPGGIGGGARMIQPRNNLWRLARDSYGDGVRYTDIYAANRTEIEDPDLIYPGQIIGIPARN